MKREEVEHLATLARLKLTPDELDSYATQMGEILEYIDKIKEVVGDETTGHLANAGMQNDAMRHNVLREDDNVQETGVHTAEILAEAPETQDGYVKVKKIL